MIRVNWGTPDSIPFRLSDYPRLTAGLRVAGSISAETDDEARGQSLRTTCASLLNETLAGYGDKVSKDGLARLTPELCRTLSDKLTERTGITCSVNIVSLSLDEQTQKIINDMDRAQKMSDPAYAAAELERAMKQAQETAMKNGMSQEDIQRMAQQGINMPDLPPLPDTDDPIARAKAVMEQAERVKQMAKSAPIASAAPIAAAPHSAQRPKFCANCGQRLPESGNFCPNCGNKI